MMIPQAVVQAGVSIPYVQLSHTLSAGTGGGTATSGSWQTHPLNTEDVDTDGICTLTSDHFVLSAGTYETYFWSWFYHVGQFKIRLRNTTDSSTIQVGLGGGASAGDNTGDHAMGAGRFSIADGKNIELQYFCEATQATTGLGISSGISGSAENEVYAQIVLRKMA